MKHSSSALRVTLMALVHSSLVSCGLTDMWQLLLMAHHDLSYGFMIKLLSRRSLAASTWTRRRCCCGCPWRPKTFWRREPSCWNAWAGTRMP